MNYGNRIYGMWTESTAHLTQRQSRGRAIPWRTGLLRIANECPHTDGACVYAARILYNKLAMASTGDYISFPDDCNPSGLYKKDNIVAEIKLFDVNLIPNPTSAGFSIISLNNMEADLDVSITDITGKKVFIRKVKTVNYNAFIDVHLLSGTYIVKIINNKNETVIKKLLVH
jgi:hypothetical protein